jgi:hypothetical protein
VPHELYRLETSAADAAAKVLVHGLEGFIDAGGGVRLATEHLLSTLPGEKVATFDVDLLYDYRARRPLMRFETDHWAEYSPPELVVHRLTDQQGTPFLLLTGPEPDVMWERFVIAVRALADELAVAQLVGLQSIPWAVPHTRPVGVIPHGNRPDALPGRPPVQAHHVLVPAAIGHLLEFRLADSRDVLGLAAQVPHYLAQISYPAAAETLLSTLAAATGLALPTAALAESAAEVRRNVEEQVARDPQAAAVIASLESDYDAATSGSLLAGMDRLPTPDELGAEFESFLADQRRRGGAADNPRE